MKEVVNEILAAEKKVEEKLAEARRKAALIRQESEKEASAIVSAAREEAQQLIEKRTAAARNEAESIRKKAFEDAGSENRQLLEKCRDTMDALVDEIASLVMASDQMHPEG